MRELGRGLNLAMEASDRIGIGQAVLANDLDGNDALDIFWCRALNTSPMPPSPRRSSRR